MEESEETILDETLDTLYKDHSESPTGKKHENGLAVFNWLVTKSFSRKKIPDTSELLNIERSQIRSSREERTTEGLRNLQQLRGQQNSNNPRIEYGIDSPIIIVEYKEKSLLIDGNHRINKWHRDGNTKLHRVNFHRITDGKL